MTKTLTVLALGATMMIAPGLIPAADADHAEWVFGASFQIGGAYFNIGYFPAPDAHYAPVYYYRTRAALHYRDHVCHDRCYHRGGYVYHHASCPLVSRHFRHHRFEPRAVFVRYAPPFRIYDRYDDGPRYRRDHDRGRYDRRDHDRGRHDRRHYDRGRYDRRDHDRKDYDRGYRRGDDDRGRHHRHDRGRPRGHHRDRDRDDD